MLIIDYQIVSLFSSTNKLCIVLLRNLSMLWNYIAYG